MNVFEKDVQSKRNDFSDSATAFFVSAGFFITIFVIATVIKMIGA